MQVILQKWLRAGEMTQLIKVLEAKPGDLSSVLGMHRMKGENLLLKTVLSPPHVWGDMSVLLHTKQTNKQM